MTNKRVTTLQVHHLAFYLFMALPLVALLAPWVWVPRLWFAAALSFAFAELARTPDLNMGLATIVGYAIIISFFGLCLLFLWLRYLVTRWHAARRGRRFEPVMTAGRVLRWLDILLLLASGGLLGLSMLTGGFEGVYRGFLIHGIVSLVSLVFAGGLLFLIRRPGQKARNPLTILLGLSLTVAIASALGSLQPLNVIASAQEIAQGRAHCILLLDRKQEPRSWEDLTFFAMDKRRRAHHAMLLVRGESKLLPYHWSYRAQAFLPGIVNWDNHRRPKERCALRERFVDDLPLLNP